MKVALKRQQAAEDAVALGLRTIATGNELKALPPGPIFGMKIADAEFPLSPQLKETTTTTTTTTSSKHEARIPKDHISRDSPPTPKEQKSPPLNISSSLDDKNGSPTSEPPTPKDILRKLFPSYDEDLLDQVLLQNDHNLVKTIQKLAPQTPHSHPLGFSTKHSSGASNK